MFWVGLMDGDGSIQVNQWRMKYLQYRLVIKLKGNNYNKTMLINIAKHIGGTVRDIKNKNEVIWVMDDKENIVKTINIFNMYPPLTSRLVCQLKFMKMCLKNNSISNYIENRSKKYKHKLNLVRSNTNLIAPSYFPSWLSGFIEAEGGFSVRKNGSHSFSIGQNDDNYLLNMIKNYFNISVNIRNPYDNFYVLETYKKLTLNAIIDHCYKYPLLGDKHQSLDELRELFKQ